MVPIEAPFDSGPLAAVRGVGTSIVGSTGLAATSAGLTAAQHAAITAAADSVKHKGRREPMAPAATEPRQAKRNRTQPRSKSKGDDEYRSDSDDSSTSASGSGRSIESPAPKQRTAGAPSKGHPGHTNTSGVTRKPPKVSLLFGCLNRP